jgi:microcystin-dependent protein
MSEPFLAEIRIFAGNFAPRGWAFCDGQILPISQNQALFSLLGTTFGGNGSTTFALPDLRGRVPIHEGQSSGGSPHPLGEKGGIVTHGLGQSETEVLHSHALPAAGAGSVGPTSATAALEATDASGSADVSNLQPYLALSFIIAIQGLFPSPS